MKLLIAKGTTSVMCHIYISDSSSTTGAGLTGLVYNTPSLAAYSQRSGQGSPSTIALVDATAGVYTASGFKELDSAKMPGWYFFCPPDSCFSLANNPGSCSFTLLGATNMAPCVFEIQTDARWAAGEYSGLTVGSGSTSTSTKLATTESSADNALKQGILYIPSIGEAKRITGYTGSTRACAHTAWTSGAALADGTPYVLIPSADVDVGAVESTPAQTVADATLATVVESEGSITLAQWLRVGGSVLFGRSSGNGLIFKTPNNNATRVTVTVDGSKNRTGVTLNP